MAKEIRQEQGKGGNFATRPNPFVKARGEVALPKLTDSTQLIAGLDLAVRAGCGVLLGTTRDGGAYVLTIMDGADRHRTYCNTLEELNDAGYALVELYT